jgi:hypothetical protein
VKQRIAVGIALVAGLAAGVAAQQKSQTVNGLEMTVKGIEYASQANLKACPPDTNTVKAMARPGEQYAIVTVDFKVGSSFKAAPMKRPQATDTAGKTYNTSMQFIDVGSQPSYTCAMPFRVPEGTKLKSLQVETATFDLSSLAK